MLCWLPGPCCPAPLLARCGCTDTRQFTSTEGTKSEPRCCGAASGHSMRVCSAPTLTAAPSYHTAATKAVSCSSKHLVPPSGPWHCCPYSQQSLLRSSLALLNSTQPAFLEQLPRPKLLALITIRALPQPPASVALCEALSQLEWKLPEGQSTAGSPILHPNA